MDKSSDVDRWRDELINFREKRDRLITELGEYAQENRDLRENSAYLHTEQKIQIVDAQITGILAEFGKINLARKKAEHALKKPRKLSRVDL
ncbi:MAG: hypothetical protein WC988_02600 [Patescibacteria group bacterium]